MHEFLYETINDPSAPLRPEFKPLSEPVLELAPPRPFEEAIAPIYSNLVRILGKVYRNHPEVDDLIQEGLVYLWQKWKLNTGLFEQQSLPYIVGMAKRGSAGRYLELMNGRTKFDGGSLDDPENLKRPAVQQKINGGHGREVHLAELRVDLTEASQQIHAKYQTRQNTQFNAKKREQLDHIFRDFLDDRDPKETASEIGMTVKSVRHWHSLFREDFRELLPDYGSPEERNKRPYTEAEVTTIFQLAAQGLTYRQIATKLGRSIDSVTTKFYEVRAAQALPAPQAEVLALAGD